MQTKINESTPATRLYVLFEKILKDSSFVPAMYHPIVINVVKGFLKSTDESELLKQIFYLRDEIIPFIIGENVSDTD